MFDALCLGRTDNKINISMVEKEKELHWDEEMLKITGDRGSGTICIWHHKKRLSYVSRLKKNILYVMRRFVLEIQGELLLC